MTLLLCLPYACCDYPASYHNVFAQARIWAASIGYSLLFGPMLAKAVRVYFVVTRSEKDLKQRVSLPVLSF